MPIFEHDDEETPEEWKRQAEQAFKRAIRMEQREFMNIKEEELYQEGWWLNE